MQDILIDIGITTLLSLLKREIPKNSTTKKKWKKALLKVFLAIRDAYQDDNEFNASQTV